MRSALGVLERINSALLSFSRSVGWVFVLAMVAIILLQVFFRYVLNAALPWPEEAARALMIWMIAFMAPTSYRWSGFVAIDMLPDALPRKGRLLLQLFILLMSMLVLVVLLSHAWTHFSSPILFNSSGLNRMLQDSGINQLLGTSFEFRTSYIYLAMSVCFGMMVLIGIELIWRTIGRLVAGDEAYPEPPMPAVLKGN